MKIRDYLTEKRLSQLEGMVTEILPQQLNAKFRNGEIFKLIEISEPSVFADAHIENAINVTLEQIVDVACRECKTFQQIVLYTPEKNSDVGKIAAHQLDRAGYGNVQVLKGGKEAWREAYLPLVGSKC